MSDKTVLQKLLVKEGYRFLLLRAPGGYLAAAGEPPAGVVIETDPGSPGPFDIIQDFVTTQVQVEERLAGLAALLKPKGLLWITYPKGAARIKSDVNRDTIWRYARTIGLDAVAMISVDDVWSAMRIKVAA